MSATFDYQTSCVSQLYAVQFGSNLFKGLMGMNPMMRQFMGG